MHKGAFFEAILTILWQNIGIASFGPDSIF